VPNPQSGAAITRYVGELADPLGDELGVFDKIGRGVEDAGDEDRCQARD
jgi:hypothetical protein